MKAIYKIGLIAFVLLAVACDPLEDEINSLDKTISDDFEYTLTDDDYETADDACGCARFGNFSSEDDVKANVPIILTDVFPALGNGSSAIITYKFFNGSSPDLRGTYTVVTVPAQDYLDLGFSFGNFGNVDNDVAEWANWKYPNAEDGDYADVTFDYFSGGVFTGGATSRVVYTVAYGWQYAMILPDEVYGDFFGESGIDFSNSDEGEEKMPVYLNYLLSTADEFNTIVVEEGQTIVVQYNFDDRFTDPDNPGDPNVPDVALYIFDGTEWLLYNDHFQNTTESLSFGHDGTVWVPDNTIKYTFTAADFVVAGDEANGLGNAAARDNLNNFGNFGTQWSHEEIVGAINFVLKMNFPSNEVGQKYVVTYNTFPAGDLSVKLILDASGDYIEQ